jgi:hypothetical protein
VAGCTIKEFLEFIGCHLKDEEHVRWTEGYLLHVIEISIRQIQSDRKDLFKEDKKIKLEPGCYTQVCKQGCEDISKPFRIPGDECDDLEVIDSNEDWVSEYFPLIRCNDDDEEDEYKPERIQIDLEDPCTIKVEPEVPDDGRAYYIIAKCQRDIDQDIANGVLPSGVCKHYNAFIQLVLFYTYGMDSMVNLDQSQSQQYFENYLTLIGLTYMNDLSHREKEIVLKQLLDRSKRIGVQ